MQKACPDLLTAYSTACCPSVTIVTFPGSNCDFDTLHALRDTYRQGIPRRFGDTEIRAAARLFAVLAREGGAELVGANDRLSEGTFRALPDACRACPTLE